MPDHKTAESQQSAGNTGTGHQTTEPATARTHGLNRRTETENQSSPRLCRTAPGHQPRHHRKPAESQQSAGNTSTGHQTTKHGTARTHGLNRESHDEIGSSPHRHRPWHTLPTAITPQTRRIPTIRTHYHHQPSPNQPLGTPEPRTKPENIGQNRIQSTPMPDHVRPPTTASSQTRGITEI